jgi:hypothetical protein
MGPAPGKLDKNSFLKAITDALSYEGQGPDISGLPPEQQKSVQGARTLTSLATVAPLAAANPITVSIVRALAGTQAGHGAKFGLGLTPVEEMIRYFGKQGPTIFGERK